MRVESIRILTVAAVAVGTLLTAAAPASAAPTISVTPATGLSGGDSVSVQASGLPPGADVQVNQCDTFVGDPDLDCYDITSVTTAADGSIATSVTLGDPVYKARPFGDPTPVYCRADTCRVFLTWTDSAGQEVLASDPLEFTGSPATITATPSTGLHRSARVSVHGTAYGAEGHTVIVSEEACFSVVQGSGCYGTTVKYTGTVGADGTFASRFKVTRFLTDGTDCADPDILGACEVNAEVLDSTGRPDDSFGVSRMGQPAAWLSFRG